MKQAIEQQIKDLQQDWKYGLSELSVNQYEQTLYELYKKLQKIKWYEVCIYSITTSYL